MMPIRKLADKAQELEKEGHYQAIKLRVGRDRLADDLAAVRSVRQRVGDDVRLMVDFNQKLTVNEALFRGRALDDEGLYWIEEATRHDDYSGYARLAAALRMRIQSGENLPNTHEMLTALAEGAQDFVMCSGSGESVDDCAPRQLRALMELKCRPTCSRNTPPISLASRRRVISWSTRIGRLRLWPSPSKYAIGD